MSENSQLLPAVSSFLSSPRQLLIDGEWVDAKDGQTFDTLNPATEEVLATVAQASAVDADRAVVAARNAFESGSPWSRMTPRERSHLLWRIGDMIDERAEEFAQLESLDNGKSLVPFWLVAAAGRPTEEVRLDSGKRFDELWRGGWDPVARLADQDTDGVVAEVIYPSVGMLLCNHPDADYQQLTRDVRGFATEVRRLGYSSVASGHENQFLELSERMSRRCSVG